MGAQLEDLGHRREGGPVALVGDDARVLVLDLAAAVAQLAQDHLHRLEQVERLEARDHDRAAVVGRDELERPAADDGRDVAGADEAVEPEVWRLEQRPQRRHDRDVVAHAREVAQSLRLRPFQRQCGRRRSRLEADGEEHDLAVGVLLGDPHRVERRVDHAHVRALGLGVEQRAVRSGHPQHVAEAREDHVRLVSDRDAVVDPAHRDHAHRAAGAVDELDVRRQQVVDAVLVDRVRVPAAHLHDLVVAARLDGRQDLAGQGAAELGIAELVDELHGRHLLEADEGGAGVHEHGIPGRDVSDQLDVHPLPRARDVLAAPRQALGRIGADDAQGDRDVAAGDAVLVGVAARVGGHSITLAFSSSSSCSYSAPIRSSRRSVACASSSSTFDRAKPTWISTQSPGCALPPPSSRRLTLTLRRTPAISTVASRFSLVHELDHLSRNGQAHASSSLSKRRHKRVAVGSVPPWREAGTGRRNHGYRRVG